MLPKVSAALKQFIAPIKLSAPSSGVRERPESNSKGSKNPKEKKEEKRKEPEREEKKPHLKLVAREAAPVAHSTSETVPAERPSEKFPQIGIGNALLQLIKSIPWRNPAFFKWIGLYTYERLMHERVRGAKFRKGSFLDHKAE